MFTAIGTSDKELQFMENKAKYIRSCDVDYLEKGGSYTNNPQFFKKLLL